ncbi:ATP cone domain-containing protein, partial [Sphingomonas pseudosanguinis]|uniref:ATP cone domain-containing protein n=1 Tax=Sphingomonas pseudosanguinis TaxID=413712 RepID=UPI0030B88410
PIDPVRVEKLVSGIQRQLERSGEGVVSSKRIGAMVMEGLKGLESVAYIRFARVYREFGGAQGLLAATPPPPRNFIHTLPPRRSSSSTPVQAERSRSPRES